MAKITEEELATILEIKSKIMCQNTIVLYHLKLKTEHEGLMLAEDFNRLMDKFNIKLTEKSFILRVNVDKMSQGYYVKQGSNTPDILATYGARALFPTGMAFNNLVLKELTDYESIQDGVDALKSWLKKGEFALFKRGGKDFCYVDTSEGTLGINNKRGLVRQCRNYVLCCDIESYGIDKSMINVVANCEFEKSSSNDFRYMETKVIVTDTGWYLEEHYGVGEVFKSLRDKDNIRVYLSRDLTDFYSNLPKKVARELNYRVPQIGFHQIGNIPLEDKTSIAEAMACLFYLRNNTILKDCYSRDAGGFLTFNHLSNAEKQAAVAKGYVRFPKPTVSEKVEAYVTANFNHINPTLKPEQTKSAQPEKQGFFKRLFS